MQKEKTIQPADPDTTPTQKLLVSGFILLEQDADPIPLQRGMSVMAQDGIVVGAVAAVMLNCHSQEITHLLLGQVPPTAVYRLIPLSLIDRIDEEMVWLRITSAEKDTLPIHQLDC